MKQYIRTKDGRFAEVKENMEVKVECDFGYFNKVLLYKDTTTLVLSGGNSNIIKETDNVFSLIQVGDLIRTSCDFTLKEVSVEVFISIIKERLDHDCILEIFTKQRLLSGEEKYILVWDKERGVI